MRELTPSAPILIGSRRTTREMPITAVSNATCVEDSALPREGCMRFRWLLLASAVLISAIACSSSGSDVASSPVTAAETSTVAAEPTVTPLPPTPVPASEWVSVASMNVGRTAYSASVLNDGRVLVVGGLGEEGILHSAEIYDPDSDTWTRVADTIHSRRKSILATLEDGRVVVAGGEDNLTASTAEIFDPARNSWTEIPPLNVGRESAMAVPLNDGRLFVFGGGNGVIGSAIGRFELASAEIYDPELNEWTLVGSMAQAEIAWEGWVKLNDGRVVLTGGDFARPNKFVQIFNPATDTWRRVTELPNPTGGGAAVLLPDGNVLVAGGGFRCCLTESLVFDIETEEWAPGPEMLVQRGGHIGLNLPDGRIVFLHGLDPDFPFSGPQRGGEILDPVSGEREILADYPGVFDLVNPVVVLKDGRVMQIGGRFSELDSTETVKTSYSTDVFLLRSPDR